MILTPKALDCDTARSLMFDYIDGVLCEADVMRLEYHIKSCDACKCELEARREMLESVAAAGYGVPTTLYEGIMEKITHTPQEKSKDTWIGRFKPWMGTLGAVCAALMILVVGRAYLNSGAGDVPMQNDAAGGYARIDADRFDSPEVGGADAEPCCEDIVLPLDMLLAKAGGLDLAVLICNKSDFPYAVSDKMGADIEFDGIRAERYVIENDAAAVLSQYRGLLSEDSADFRVALPGGEFDTFELWLLIDGETSND